MGHLRSVYIEVDVTVIVSVLIAIAIRTFQWQKATVQLDPAGDLNMKLIQTGNCLKGDRINGTFKNKQVPVCLW